MSLSMAYHPQMDGTTEWFNQEIEAYLSIYCTSHPKDWVDALPMIEFTHNNRRHADRKNTPFELMMGTSPLATPPIHEYTKYPSVEDQVGSLTNMCEEALAVHEYAWNHMLQQIKLNFTPFVIGQNVWLEAKNLKTIYNKKMAPKRKGPFQIMKVLSPLTSHLFPRFTCYVANPQRVSHVPTHSIRWERNCKGHAPMNTYMFAYAYLLYCYVCLASSCDDACI